MLLAYGLLATLLGSGLIQQPTGTQDPPLPADPVEDATQREAREARLRAELQLEPSSPERHAALGDFLAADGRPEAAFDAYAAALRLEPENSTYRLRLATAHLALSEWEDAELHFAYLVRNSPSDAAAYEGLAEALRGQGRYDESAEAFRRAAALAPEDAELAQRAERAAALAEPDGPSAPVSGPVATFIRILRIAMSAVLAVAGLGLVLPVVAAVALLILVVPLQAVLRRPKRQG